MNKRRIFELFFIIILGLTPLLWFHGNQVILGHDSGLTLSPVSHFSDRLSAWTERFGFGNDQTYAIAGFFIHGLDALISSLGFSLQYVQKIAFIFWFILPGLTMYYFVSKLAKKLNLKYFVLPATVLYMFNHFLLQGWFVAERTKFSVYAALPLIMSFLFDWEEKKRSTFKTALLMSLTVFFLNGEASLPLFGGLILSVAAFCLFYLIKSYSFEKVKNLGRLFGLSALISFFLNAYWLFPYGSYLLKSYGSAVVQAGGLGGVLGWLNYVSQDSSLINIFRLQGIPEWYLNPSHPYADVFFNNPLLIAVGFLIPIAAFLPLYLIRNGELRKKIIFFSFLALFSMIFVAGAHPPFGAVYVFLINFLPGFVAFRNPFYKFAPALWFSYAILIGFTVDYLLRRLEIKKIILLKILYLVIGLGIVLYSFPFLNGIFFDYIKNERSMRVVVPQYVLDFGKWSEGKDRLTTKVLALPPVNPENNVDAYSWGYWSLSPLTSLLTNAPVINESSYMSATEKALIEELYNMIKNDKPGWQNFAKLLGIKSFLLRGDFAYNSKGSPTDNPSVFRKVLNNSDLILTKKFGDWEVYDFKDTTLTDLETSSKINYLVGDSTDLGKVSSLPFFNPKEPIYVSTTPSKNLSEILKFKDKTFLVPTCVACNLQHKFIDINSFIPTLTRDSIFYPIVKLRNSAKEKKLVKIPEKVNYYLYQSLSNILVFDKFVSQKADQGVLLIDSLGDYGNSLNQLDKNLQIYLQEDNIDNNFLLEVSDVLRIEKTIIIRNSTNLTQKDVLDVLNDKYNLMQKISGKVDKNIGRTIDENNKKFLMYSNGNQEFDFLYKPNTSNLSSIGDINYTLDNQSHTAKATSISSEWFSLGKLNLTKGLHNLDIPQVIENLYTGASSFQLNSSSNFYCFSSNKIKGYKNEVYKISFQHRRLSGSKNFFAKVVAGDKKPNQLDATGDILRSSSVWDNYTAFWPAQDLILKNDSDFYLTICNPPTVDKEDFTSTIEIKDISIRKITVPDVVLYNESSPVINIGSKFNRKSSTEYSVSAKDIDGARVIVLGEEYNDNWVLNDSKNDVKFTANGYASGWLVKETGKDLTIKYGLQDFVKVGFILSGISALLGILYLVLKFRKNG